MGSWEERVGLIISSPGERAPEVRVCALTEVLLLGLGLLDQAEQHLREVADDDEGRGQRGPAVVLHDEVVALELPEDVRVALHHLEGVAGEESFEL